MYCEFLDQLIHVKEGVTAEIRALAQSQIDEALRDQFATPNSRELIEKLLVLTQDGSKAKTILPAQRLLVLFQSGALHGLGDYLQKPPLLFEKHVEDTYEAILE